MSLGTLSIGARVCGPPTSGNGGYVAGRLARFVPTDAARPAVAVRLFAPPPLEVPLEVREDADRVELFEGERLLARAEPVPLELSPPPQPPFEAAEAATKSFRGFDEHPFPGCFVCGTDRDVHDGLRIFPGRADDGGLFAASWTPAEGLPTGSSDDLDGAIVWAALDCAGAFSFPQVDGVVLLGELRARVFDPIRIGEPCVVTSWYLQHDGRKHVTGTALHGRDGTCAAYARGTWIEVDPDSVPREPVAPGRG